MTRDMVYKSILIIAIIAFAVLLILPTVGEMEMLITLESDAVADQIGAIDKRFPVSKYAVAKKENTIRIRGYGLSDAVMNEVKTFQGVRSVQILPHWAEKALLAKKMNLGLDLQGGMNLVLRADFESIEKKENRKLTDKDKTDITQQALELLRNRIDKFGVSEPSIRPRGAEAIEIQLPGVKDPSSVKKAIGTTGRVEYRIVNDDYTRVAGERFKVLVAGMKNQKLNDNPDEQSALLNDISRDIKLPAQLELLYYYQRDENTKKIFPAYPMALNREIALAGNDISKAWVGQDEYGRMAVHFTTTPEGATKFADVTSEKNHGKRMAVIIDDKIRSAPQINVQISTGQALIQGDFTFEEVNTLARIIKEGALPVNLAIIEERTVGPSLGQDAIDAGIKATLVALCGVMLFMIAYYKVAGVLANIGLVINFTLMLALLSWLGFTLTLPGIAGLILTIGMAVDGNVLIYERMKEEFRNGKSVRVAVTNGFDRAFWAIFDSNLTTLIAAFVLAQFGTGPIKGFAVTLSIGIICSMFVVLYITRFVYESISMKKNIQKLSI